MTRCRVSSHLLLLVLLLLWNISGGFMKFVFKVHVPYQDVNHKPKSEKW